MTDDREFIVSFNRDGDESLVRELDYLGLTRLIGLYTIDMAPGDKLVIEPIVAKPQPRPAYQVKGH